MPPHTKTSIKIRCISYTHCLFFDSSIPFLAPVVQRGDNSVQRIQSVSLVGLHFVPRIVIYALDKVIHSLNNGSHVLYFLFKLWFCNYSNPRKWSRQVSSNTPQKVRSRNWSKGSLYFVSSQSPLGQRKRMVSLKIVFRIDQGLTTPCWVVSVIIFIAVSLSFIRIDILDTSKFPVPHRSSMDVERFEFDLLKTFQTEWFEVAIWPRKTGEEFPEFLAPDQVIESFPAGSPNRERSRTRSAKRSAGRLHSESGLYSRLP